jgi:hypothetical protein
MRNFTGASIRRRGDGNRGHQRVDRGYGASLIALSAVSVTTAAVVIGRDGPEVENDRAVATFTSER